MDQIVAVLAHRFAISQTIATAADLPTVMVKPGAMPPDPARAAAPMIVPEARALTAPTGALEGSVFRGLRKRHGLPSALAWCPRCQRYTPRHGPQCGTCRLDV